MNDGAPDLALAQQIVVDYARTLERDLTENRLPARVDSLPHAKAAIRDAIESSVTFLSSTDVLTDDLRDFFETASVSLAEYLEPELLSLVTEYRQAGEELSARASAAEADALRARFRQLVTP